MHSPLPDSSVLEAGLIEDPVPPILSRVQDNVRNLLRSSHFSAIVDDDLPPLPRRGRLGVAKEVATPERAHSRSLPSSVVEVVESPSSGSTTSIPTTSTPTTTMPQPAVPGVLFPPSTYTQDLRREAHHAGSESVAMLSHPDLTEQSSTTYVQHKSERRQQQSYKRSKANKRRAQAGSGQSIFAVLAALLLASIVATYVVIAATSGKCSTTFHVLFVLGIILATIVFVHSITRLALFRRGSRSRRKVLVLPISTQKSRNHQHEQHHTRRRQHHRHHHRGDHDHDHRHRPQHREMPAILDDSPAFVPATAIQVHMPTDEVLPDGREAQPTVVDDAIEECLNAWDKDETTLPNPPPAYGRWRGSVRADPELLHWQAVPSPADAGVSALPSPTYEQLPSTTYRPVVAAGQTGPPSYVTRDGPGRRAEVSCGGVRVRPAQVAEPEMFEVRAVGLAT